MQVLPVATKPPGEPIRRRHPPLGPYRSFRACLRWEFGFTCAFCLIHEADLMAGGIEGAGLTGTEHQHRRTAAPSMADDYGNNFYACRFCNGARHTAPEVDAEGRRLLDPCAVAWADHFGLEGHELRPVEGDRDADYTHRTYDLDDPRKTEMRRNRTRLVTEALRALSGTWQRKRALLELAARTDVDRTEIIEAVELLELQRRRARGDLQRFDPIPHDAPQAC